MTSEALAEQVKRGDVPGLARAISVVENRDPGHRELIDRLHACEMTATVVGITGSPGTGKSTLVAGLVSQYRDRSDTVAVLAIDPSSPFSGGAILGDRVRMGAANTDAGVFVRSLSTRGTLGGLSPAIDDVVTLVEAAGFDRVIVETVGAGQNEVEIVRTADTVAVVTQPGSGDDVQLLKAGIVEIGDVYVVNKVDRPGADATVRELRRMLDEASPRDPGWHPSVIETVATTSTGLETLLDALERHRAYLEENEEATSRRRTRTAAQLRRIIRTEIDQAVDSVLSEQGGLEAMADEILSGDRGPYAAAEELLAAAESRGSGARRADSK